MKAKVFSGQTSLLFFLFSILFISCKPMYDLRHLDFGDSYRPLQSFLYTHCGIIHQANDTSILVLEIPVTQNGFQKDSAHFFIRFRLYENMNALIAFDSLKTLVTCFPSGNYYHLEIPFHQKMNENSYLYLHLDEKSSLKHFEQLIDCNKQSNAPGFIYSF